MNAHTPSVAVFSPTFFYLASFCCCFRVLLSSCCYLRAVIFVLLCLCCCLYAAIFVLISLCCRLHADTFVMQSLCRYLCAVVVLLIISAGISDRRRQALPYVVNDAWRLTFINNANACLLFAPVVFFFEGTILWQVRGFKTRSLTLTQEMVIGVT